MSYQDILNKINLLKSELTNLDENDFEDYKRINKEIKSLQIEAKKSLTPWDRVCIARDVNRPRSMEYINS